MKRGLAEVMLLDAVRTPFGRAGEKGLFWKTRAEYLCVPPVKALEKAGLTVADMDIIEVNDRLQSRWLGFSAIGRKDKKEHLCFQR